MEQCNNPQCEKEFYVSSIGGGVPGGKELISQLFARIAEQLSEPK